MGNEFKGKYNYTLDAKNRTIIPAKLRDALGATFVITIGPEGCLYIYPNSEWDQIVESLRKLPATVEAGQFRRNFMANASDCETDSQGRFMIPAELCERAGLKKDVVFSGNINKIELWAKDRFADSVETFNNTYELVNKMAEYGISY